MTTLDALNLAIKVLREKAEIERVNLHMVESAPAIARQIDPHATIRFNRLQDAIAKLTDLKQREAGGEIEPPDQAEVEL